MNITVTYQGVNISHDAAFLVDRPQGSGDYVFIYFSTAVNLLDQGGTRITAPGACILYAPPHPQWYRASGDFFSHDWFHCEGEDMRELIARYHLPANTVFYPRGQDFITPIVSEIAYESSTDDMYRRNMNALHVERLFICLARELEAGGRQILTPYKAGMLPAFRDLRFQVHQQSEREWALAAMAEEMELSLSRFSVLYKEFFGISPIEDVIESRLRQACYLLTNTALAIKEIADQCGFTNIYYFSRLFKKRFRCTPSKYFRRSLARPAAGPY
jgi:AraC-like DNA-binding protein